LLSGGADILAASIYGELPTHFAALRHSEVSKYLLQHYYATTRRLPLHDLVEDLTRNGIPNSIASFPPLRAALHRNVLGTGDVVEIIEYLVDRNTELLATKTARYIPRSRDPYPIVS
jgi:hypothetical protein